MIRIYCDPGILSPCRDCQTARSPRHPQVIAAAAQVAQSRRRIDEELSRIAETALSDYNRARASEEEIERSVDGSRAM